MVFASMAFLFFFLPATFCLYFAWRNRTWRNIILLIVSLFFYAWGEPLYVALMIASIVINWALALAMAHRRTHRKAILIAGVSLNLLGIGIFKYSGFLLENVNDLLGMGWPAPHIALPIGISFYTFQAISYLGDVYRGVVKPQRNPLFFGAYLSMFPQLIAGPIVRYETIENEILNRRETVEDFSAGVRRFVIGLAKKALIANTMGAVADTIIEAGPASGAIPAWFAFVGYAFQIYFDFSGYSDMAIGLGRMFGFHFLDNFNYPYVARSVTDFWRRWHISLSTFFRDYLYIPLGGNRVRPARWALNLVVVWALTGLWHGASWNFVCWGLYYGLLLIGEKLLWSRLLAALPRVLQHGYTIGIFLIGWVIFRIEDFALMGNWLGALFGACGAGHPATLNALNLLHLYPWFLIAAVGSTPWPARWIKRLSHTSAGGWVWDACIVGLLVWSIASLAISGFNPFIYFRF